MGGEGCCVRPARALQDEPSGRREDGRTETKMAVKRHPRGKGRTRMLCNSMSATTQGKLAKEPTAGKRNERRTDFAVLLPVDRLQKIQRQDGLCKARFRQKENASGLKRQTHVIKSFLLCHKRVSSGSAQPTERKKFHLVLVPFRTSVTRVVEKQGIVRFGVFDELMHSSNLRRKEKKKTRVSSAKLAVRRRHHPPDRRASASGFGPHLACP